MEHYYFYHDDIKTGLRGEGCGYRKATVRSVGRKWVYLRFANEGNFRRLAIKKWQDICRQKDFRTWEGHVAESKIKRKALDKGLSFYKKRYNKNIPKTIDELQEELEVN